MGAPSRDSTDASGRGSLLAGLTATTALVGWEAADGQGKRLLYLASLVARLMVCMAGTVSPCAVQLHVWFFLITLRWGESTSSAFKSQMPHALYRLCLTSHTLSPVLSSVCQINGGPSLCPVLVWCPLRCCLGTSILLLHPCPQSHTFLCRTLTQP